VSLTSSLIVICMGSVAATSAAEGYATVAVGNAAVAVG